VKLSRYVQDERHSSANTVHSYLPVNRCIDLLIFWRYTIFLIHTNRPPIWYI